MHKIQTKHRTQNPKTQTGNLSVCALCSRRFVFSLCSGSCVLGFLLVPYVVLAQTVFQVAGALNIFVGLMAVAAILTFAAGLGYYFSRLGLHSRVEGIHIMEWGVAMVFVLIVLMALVRFIRLHTETVLAIVSFAVFVLIIIALIRFSAQPEKKEH